MFCAILRAGISGVLIAAALGGCGQAAQSQGSTATLTLERTIDLPGVSGRIDHLAFDAAHHRLFIAELGNGTVEAVDLDTGKVAGRIAGLNEPQGLAYLPDRGELVVASGDGVVGFYRADNLTSLGTLKLGDDADNVRLDPASGRILVGYGRGALASIDPASRKVVATLALAAHPESFRIDGASHRVFVNLPGAGQIAVGDLASGKVVETRKAAHAAGYPMALAPQANRVAVAYRLPSRLTVTEAGSGKVVADVALCGDSDDLFYDLKRRRLYVSCGSGDVDVFDTAGDSYRRLERIQSRPGARTSLFIPEMDRLIVAARANGGRPAALLIFKPAGA
jgi:DNA-binding beta-propeller fold protein YncE